MRSPRLPALLLLLLATAALFVAFAGAVPAKEARCVVQLRVNVFGGGHEGTTWALQGALTVGASATLRAVARGCAGGIDRIAARSADGPAATDRRLCLGATGTCFWRVRMRTQATIDFQAFANDPAGKRVSSNIVRVVWAGEDKPLTWTGTWMTNYGPLVLTQTRLGVVGDYTDTGPCPGPGRLLGRVDGLKLGGTWSEDNSSCGSTDNKGTFTFFLSGTRFTGTFKSSQGRAGGWNGRCTAGPCTKNVG